MDGPVIAGSGRAGIALPVVLLVTLALAVMAHAVLVVAGTESAVARTDAARVVRERREAAALAALEYASDSLPPAGRATWTSVGVAILRLSGETALLVSRDGGSAGAPGRARILWAPDPSGRLRDRAAWVQTDGGVVAASGAVVRRSTDPAPCPNGVVPPPSVPVWGRPIHRGPHPGLGPVPITALVHRLSARPPGRVNLDEEMAAAVQGDVQAEGAGRGVLAVGGTLTLQSGSHLDGWVWVSGDLVVEADARFHGVADVGGTVRVGSGGVVQADPCLAAEILGGTGALRRPWGIGPLAWPAQ